MSNRYNDPLVTAIEEVDKTLCFIAFLLFLITMTLCCGKVDVRVERPAEPVKVELTEKGVAP